MTVAKSPIVAFVFFVITGTEAATPTPAAPPTAMLPATMSSCSASLAVTPTEPSAMTLAWVPIVASVVIE